MGGRVSDPANTLSNDDWAFPNRLGGPRMRDAYKSRKPEQLHQDAVLLGPDRA